MSALGRSVEALTIFAVHSDATYVLRHPVVRLAKKSPMPVSELQPRRPTIGPLPTVPSRKLQRQSGRRNPLRMSDTHYVRAFLGGNLITASCWIKDKPALGARNDHSIW